MTLQESIAAGLPLDDSHVQAANTILQIADQVRPVLEAIKNCGIDCQMEINTLASRADFARAFKRNFCSDQP